MIYKVKVTNDGFVFYLWPKDDNAFSEIKKILDEASLVYEVKKLDEKDLVCHYCDGENEYVLDSLTPASDGNFYHNDCYLTCLGHGEIF